jgi:hypothetical protein
VTEKKAKELTLEMWRYLAARPNCDSKDDLPQRIFAKVKDLRNMCPLCERFLFSANGYCRLCPLLQAEGATCANDYSSYVQWACAQDDTDRKRFAERIVEIVAAWEPKESAAVVIGDIHNSPALFGRQ